MLEVRNLSCGYSGGDVVKGIDFSVNAGEIFSVTGPNGCGKTTLLRTLCGIIPYRGGSAKINGEEISGLKREELSRRTALLSQTGAGGEYADFTVFDTVMLGRYARSKGFGTSKADREAVERCLEQTGTTDLRSRLITELSGGQLQRVFLARAFAQEPDIIFLDEPANHLDIKYQLKLLEILREWASGGKTVVGVFHDLNLAASLSDRMMLMNDGKCVLSGNAAEVCRSERLSEVYGFDVRGYMKGSLKIWE
ncbi:MAG: ABC transporter ATP-binding protein [Oscillospiraceae bacterium]|nr:ABC transporter ATP-binding protein [Oscillospiraceae bacterium]